MHRYVKATIALLAIIGFEAMVLHLAIQSVASGRGLSLIGL